MIERNKNPVGRIGNMLFGICAVGDGLVRILSLGRLHTRFCSECTKCQTIRRFKKLKEARQ